MADQNQIPALQRGRIVALFMTAIAMSGVVGGPPSGWIMTSMAGSMVLGAVLSVWATQRAGA